MSNRVCIWNRQYSVGLLRSRSQGNMTRPVWPGLSGENLKIILSRFELIQTKAWLQWEQLRMCFSASSSASC